MAETRRLRSDSRQDVATLRVVGAAPSKALVVGAPKCFTHASGQCWKSPHRKVSPHSQHDGGEVAFSSSTASQPGDDQPPSDVDFTCLGAAPPAGWVYDP